MRIEHRLLLPALMVLASSLTAQDRCEKMLAELSLEQRAAQLIVCFSEARLDDGYPRRDELRSWIEDLGIGGVIVSDGTMASVAALAADLQTRSKVPLLIAADYEMGTGFRLEDGMSYGSAMLLGATGSSDLAYEVGKATALEAKALGVHWNFAPVLDVNVNPENPVIGTRSFGEDPALVARLGAAFIRGSQQAGVMATAKHFPGHGDVTTDSHETLPTVSANRERLDQVELRPFREAIAAGVGAVMSGHLLVPALDPESPATMSRAILTDLLRDELGFEGLIVTDALDMGAIEDPAEAAVRALAAGADVLLMPPDPRVTRDALVAAVRAGRVPASRLDQACLRVLRAKERAGLLATAPDHPQRGASVEPGELRGRLIDDGITLLSDPLDLLPIGELEPVVIEIFARDWEPREVFAGRGTRLFHYFPCFAWPTSNAKLERYWLYPNSADDYRARAVQAIEDCAADPKRVPVIGLFADERRRMPNDEELAAAVAGLPRAILIIFGSPYQSAWIGEGSTVLTTFDNSPSCDEPVEFRIRGLQSIRGKTPVSIPGIVERNAQPKPDQR